MEQHNPYQSPQAIVADNPGQQLAGRGARLGAAIIDTIILLVVIMPIMFVGGYFNNFAENGMLAQLGWGVASFLVFVAIQFVPLKNHGQTWGKKLVGIRIVTLDGAQPGLDILLGRRYLFANGIGLVPFIGSVASLVNVLMIFRADKRCLHDLVAGTQVVNAN